MPKQRPISRREFLKLAGLIPPALLTLSGSPLDTLAPDFQSDAAGKYNILIVVFDALSACNMSIYGYPRKTTPNIERLAKQAYVFHRHYSGGNFTTPGTASLLTGVYPWSHRAINLAGEMAPVYKDRNIFAELRGSYRSYALTHNEYVNILLHQIKDHIQDWVKTPDISVASLDTINYWFTNDFYASSNAQELIFTREEGPSSAYFFSQLLAKWRVFKTHAINQARRNEYPYGLPTYLYRHFFTLHEAINQISERSKGTTPFIGYTHLIPPHAPYVPSMEYAQLFINDSLSPAPKPNSRFANTKWEPEQANGPRQLYDEFIAEVDAEFGRLYRRLERARLLDNTILILTSDHGESFERNVIGHNTPALYEPLIRIPLLIWMPKDTGRHDITRLTSAVDVLPTLLKLNGLPIPDWAEGQPLPEITSEPVQEERSLFVVEAKTNRKIDRLNRSSVAILRGDYKLARYLDRVKDSEFYELYNLTDDPEELNDLSGTVSDVEGKLRDELLETLQQHDTYTG